MPETLPHATVFSAFTEAVARYADRTFLRSPASPTQYGSNVGAEYTYASAHRAVGALRHLYGKLRLNPGDRVALAFDSRLEVYLHLLALNAQGASLVPLNMLGSDAELLHVLRHSGARLMSGAGEHLSRLSMLAKESVGVEVFAADEARGGAPPHQVHGDATTEAALLYTSGTTGKPKGCILSNEYFLMLGIEYNALGGLCTVQPNDRLLTPLPPHHMNALATSFTAMMLCGGCVIQIDRFHPGTWWQTVYDEGATIIHYLGVMPAILLKLPPGPDDSLAPRVRFGFGAGSDPKHQAAFEQRFGFPLIEAWAMTETGGAAMIAAHEEPRHVGQRCIGRPLPHVEHRLVDEQDHDVDPGQDGELLVRRGGANPRRGFFSGYLHDELATNEGWRGGWWHTGDVVRQGPDGSLFFVDRRKNVIRRSGENISAVEVEAALMQLDAVGGCAVTAVPDEIRGDEVFAMVVAAPQADRVRLARDVFEHSMQNLAYFKAPGYVALVDELPLTASQKINRGEVRRRAAELLQSGQATDLRALKRRNR